MANSVTSGSDSSRRTAALTRTINRECRRCHGLHAGGDWDCVVCAVCNNFHTDTECSDLRIADRCRLCGEQHVIFHRCPCARCYRFHAGKDCLPFVPCTEPGSDQWQTSTRPAAMESTFPCRVCKIWHGSEACTKVRQHEGIENEDPMPDDDGDNSEIVIKVYEQHSVGAMSISCPHCAARFIPS
jgi:hypothetical protein